MLPREPTTKPARALLYIGIHGSVVALDPESGTILWTTRLRTGSSLVPLQVEGERLYALSGGEISCLDAQDGTLIWHNRLRGLGMGFACLASANGTTMSLSAAAMAAAVAATAGAAAASSAAASGR